MATTRRRAHAALHRAGSGPVSPDTSATPSAAPAATDYWLRRLQSPEVKRALATAIAAELRLLSNLRVREIVDAAEVRRVIRSAPATLLQRDALAEIVVQVHRRVLRRLERQHAPLARLIPHATLAQLEALLAEAPSISADAEAFVAELVEQELTRRLFTDLVFTAMVSFYQKVNPLFGALALRAVERQIKTFIDRFMPMLQTQATRFVLDRGNRTIVAEFARNLVHQLLRQPLRQYVAVISSSQRARAEDMLRHVVSTEALDPLLRRAARAVWDDLYAVVRHRRIGELVALDAEAEPLASRAVELLMPVLTRGPILELLAGEMARAMRRAASEGA